MGKITLTNIAEELAARSGMSKEVTENFVRVFIETIENGLREDNIVKLKGLGSFKLMEVNDRSSVDINTGERITIKGHRKVSFTPDSAMKELVNRPFAHFEPVELNEGYPSDDEETEAAENEESVNETTVLVESSGIAVDASLAQTDLPSNLVLPSEMESEVEVYFEDETSKNETIGVVEETDSCTTETEESLPEVSVEPQETAVSEVQGNDEVEQEQETIDSVESIQPAVTEENGDGNLESIEETISDDCISMTTDTSEFSNSFAIEGASNGIVEHEEESVVVPDAAFESNKSSKKGQSSRSGCGWVIVILLAGLVYGIYYLMTVDQDIMPGDYADRIEEWGDESEVNVKPETEESVTEKSEEVVGEEKTDTIMSSEKTEDLPVVKQLETIKSTPKSKFCSVTLTESLDAKTIKDITPADTADYDIDGTLITHELKSGETIIQLAKKYYGDKRLWPYIVKYNWMKDYNNVAIGQMINIPVLKEKAK